MSIQGSINQLLSMAAVGIRLSPAYDKMQKMRGLRAAEEAAKKEVRAIQLNKPGEPRTDEEFLHGAEMGEKAIDRLLDIKQQQFELDPTTARFDELVHQRTQTGAYHKTVQDLRDLAKQKAEAELSARQTEVRGPQPTITQMLGKDPEAVSSTAAWERTIRRDLNGNN